MQEITAKLPAQATTEPTKTALKYSFEEASKESLKYFHGNRLAADVWCNKYAMRDKAGMFLEKTPDDMHDRLAREFARIDSEKYGLNYDTQFRKYRKAIDKFERVVPQGSPMAAVSLLFLAYI